MKLQIKVAFVVLFLGALWVFGFSFAKEAFAVNQTSFSMTFENQGDAQSYIDYVIFEDTSGPFGQYNLGDLVLYYTGSSPDLGFVEGVFVPGGDTITVTRGPNLNYLPTFGVYVSYLPWKYEGADPRDVGCEDPTASLTARGITVISANDIHAVMGTSRSYACWVPTSAPPPSGNPGVPDQPTIYSVASQACLPASDNLPDLTFTWTGVSGATGYYVYIWDPAYLITSGIRDGTDPRWTHGSLTAGTSYRWYDLPNFSGLSFAIRSKNSVGMSSVTFWQSDTTLNCSPPDLDIMTLRTKGSSSNAAATKSSFLTGETVYVEITVRNWGSGRSADNFNTIYRIGTFSSCLPEGAQQNFATVSLGPGGQMTLNGSFPVPSNWSGVYTINAMTDVYCDVAESNEGNNRANVNFTVFRPDLRIVTFQTVDAAHTRKSLFTFGESIYVHIRVDNFGDGTAGAFNIPFNTTASYRDNCTSIPAPWEAPWTKGSLGAYASADWYSTKPIVASAAGTFTLYAMADANCQVIESDETNNRKTTNYRVAGPISGPSNLTATTACNQYNQPTITFNWTDAVNETKYWLDVHTQQWASDAEPSGWYYTVQGQDAVTFIWNNLNAMVDGSGGGYHPKRSTTYWWRLQASNIVESGDHIYPSDMTDPTQGGSITTLDCVPNLQITIDSLPDGAKGAGGNATLTVTNVGTGWTYPSGADGSKDSDGDGFTDSVEIITGTGTGKRCATTATPNDEPQDGWPADFNDDQKVDSTDMALLQVAIGTNNPRYDLNGSGGLININDFLTLAPNLGKNCTGKFEVAMNLDEAAISVPMDCSDPKSIVATAGPLGPAGSGQESITLTMPFTYPSAIGAYMAWALADSACGVSETDEGDNTATKNYLVWGYDLSATFVPGSWNKQTFQPGETATANVKVASLPSVYYTGANQLGIWPKGPPTESALPTCSALGVGASTPPDLSPFTNPLPAKFTGGTFTKTFQIQTGADDGSRGQTGFYNTTTDISAGKPFDSDDGYRSSFMRFTNVVLPKGARINSAKLTFTARDTTPGGSLLDSKVSAADEDDAQPITSIDDWDSKLHGEAIVWDYSGGWTAGSNYEIPDVKSVVQGVVNREGWVPGNSLMIFWEDRESWVDSGRVARSYEFDPVSAPKLTVEYTVTYKELVVPISFNVGDAEGTFTANAYIVPNCNIDDVNWSNNSTSSGGNISFTYTVKVEGWFETTGGDVGSGGTARVSLSPLPAGRNQSDYLLVGKTLDPSVSSAKWSINGYEKPLVAADPYVYMAERFKDNAMLNSGKCSLGSLTPGSNMNYCAGLGASVSGTPPSGNTVWFINGDMTINNNITFNPLTASTDTIIFIVSGKVTVNTIVTRIDGVYIAGGTFQDTTDGINISGNQLEVNGAVYAKTMSLARKLGVGASCVTGSPCTNAAQPGEIIKYDPKYLISLNTLLGSPGVSWKEVAP